MPAYWDDDFYNGHLTPTHDAGGLHRNIAMPIMSPMVKQPI